MVLFTPISRRKNLHFDEVHADLRPVLHDWWATNPFACFGIQAITGYESTSR
jgi:hypothetical protein